MTADRDDLSHIHQPVLVSEVLEYLRVEERPNGRYVDGTVGIGGHVEAILACRADARVLGIDRDEAALALAAKRLASFADRVTLRHGSYADVADHLQGAAFGAPDGILLDLGLSSLQLDDPARGFSFRFEDGPLDMRFDSSAGATASDFVNHARESDLADALHNYGEEPRARAVARAIVRARPITSVGQLHEVVAKYALRVRRHDPATRTFQALRMAVNEELGHLDRGLAAAIDVLTPGGRLVVLCFHSGEERSVKEAFRVAVRASKGHILTKKPIRPTDAEVRRNVRARPTRLRAFERALEEDPNQL